MDVQMKMPDLATTGSAITLVRWLVQPGQTVQRGQPLAEVETEKATSNLESIVTGVLKEARVPAGVAVSVGQVIAVLELVASKPDSRASVPTQPKEEQEIPEFYSREFLLTLYERMVL